MFQVWGDEQSLLKRHKTWNFSPRAQEPYATKGKTASSPSQVQEKLITAENDREGNSLMVLTMAARSPLLNESSDVHSGDLLDRPPVSILLFLHCFSHFQNKQPALESSTSASQHFMSSFSTSTFSSFFPPLKGQQSVSSLFPAPFLFCPWPASQPKVHREM